MLCGCGRPSKHMGRCHWRRRVPESSLQAVRDKKKEIAAKNGHQEHSVTAERLRGLLQSMEEVHLACIDFAFKYGELKRKLSRITPKELVIADPGTDPSPLEAH